MTDAFENVQNVEDLFKLLDEQNFTYISKPLAALRRSLMSEGFTRRESMRLVEAHSRFIYDMMLEDARDAVMKDVDNEDLDEEVNDSEDDPDDYAH